MTASEYQFAPGERALLPGSPHTPAHPVSRRVGYAAMGTLAGLATTFGNGLVNANLGSIAGNAGLYAYEASLLLALYVAFNASANLLLVRGRTQFGVPLITQGLLALYALAALVAMLVPGVATAAIVRCACGMASAALITFSIYCWMQALPAKVRPVALVLGISLPQVGMPLARMIPVEELGLSGWRGLAGIECALALLLLAASNALPMPPSERKRVLCKRDVVTYALALSGYLLLCLVLATGRLLWWTDTPWLGVALATSAPLLCAALVIELRRRDPLVKFDWLTTGTMVRFALVALVLRLALAEQTYGAVGLLSAGGLTNDQLHMLFGIVSLAMLAGIVVTVVTLNPARLPWQVVGAAVLIAAGALLDSHATSVTRPPQLYLSQALLGIGTTLFIGAGAAVRIPAGVAEGRGLPRQLRGDVQHHAEHRRPRGRCVAGHLPDHGRASTCRITERACAGAGSAGAGAIAVARRRAVQCEPAARSGGARLQRYVCAGGRRRAAGWSFARVAPRVAASDWVVERSAGMSDEQVATPPVEPAAVTPPPPGWQPPRRRPGVIVAIALLGLAAVLVILYTWHLPPFSGGKQRTENAYIRGRTTVIAPQVSGYVSEVPVSDYQFVHKGDVLARIDDASYAARVAQAQATLHAQQAALENSVQARAARAAALASQGAALASTRSQLERAQADARRADELVSDGSISKREFDQTLAALLAAEALVHQGESATEIARQDARTVEVSRAGLQAQVEAATAALRAAEIDLERTVIRAPEDGQLGEVGVRLGQFVAPGTTLLALVPSERWIIANYKEAQTIASAWVSTRASPWMGWMAQRSVAPSSRSRPLRGRSSRR